MAGQTRSAQPTRADAGLIRRRLATGLRQAREATGLTHQQVATELGWALTTIIRIEGGTVRVADPTLIALGGLYGSDPATVAGWQQMAKGSRWQPFRGYRDVIPLTYRAYLGLEAAATRIIQWAPLHLPELVQSARYAHAIAELSTPLPAGGDVADRRAALTAARQTGLLEQPDPPHLTVLLDEGVIERLARGPDIMLDQLLDLRRYVDHPHITIQVAGHAAGFHRGLLSAFTILEFDTDPALIFTHPEPFTAAEVTDEATGYQQTVASLAAAATHPKQLDEVIDACLGLNPFHFDGVGS
ncbi:helix-turn-helix domain-containing protein [Phytohabitans kaempferiae]|uniref:Helix-turn-helix domain-containing protein n=1 Tax=Phytohabitans kaempferiae TaxID=1620943 RepID=A0ABV6MBI9_9ACTN